MRDRGRRRGVCRGVCEGSEERGQAVTEADIIALIREQSDQWRKMRDDIKDRPKPWNVSTAAAYEQYDLIAIVLNELIELIADQDVRR